MDPGREVAVVGRPERKPPVGELSGCGGARSDWTERIDEFEYRCRRRGSAPDGMRRRSLGFGAGWSDFVLAPAGCSTTGLAIGGGDGVWAASVTILGKGNAGVPFVLSSFPSPLPSVERVFSGGVGLACGGGICPDPARLIEAGLGVRPPSIDAIALGDAESSVVEPVIRIDRELC